MDAYVIHSAGNVSKREACKFLQTEIYQPLPSLEKDAENLDVVEEDASKARISLILNLQIFKYPKQ